MSGQVKYLAWITRDMLRAEPDAVFVFGDNAERWGKGGQAKECRDEPNALGVATLYAPGRFYGPSAARSRARCLAAAAGDYRYMDNAEFDAASDWQGWSRWRAADEAARHLAAMSPERRAMLEAEWEERP